VDLGSCKFLEADVDGAIAAWRHVVASQHDAAAARSMLNLGLLYEHLHHHEQAIGLLTRVAERNLPPYVISAAMASARCQVEMGDGERTMETMARLAQLTMASRPEGAELIEALSGLGDVAEHAGRPDRAERAWRVASLSPASPIQRAASERLVQLLVRQGQSHAALRSVDVGVAGHGTSPTVIDTAELLIRTGEKAAAIELLLTVDGADLDPVDRFRLADAKLASGCVNDAIDDLEALLAVDGQVQSRALFSLGRVYTTCDMADAAVSMFQRAVTSGDPYWMLAASLALGDLLAARGDVNPACEYWSYAAAGAVSRIADQARSRLAGLAQEEAEPATVEVTTGDVVEPNITELLVAEPSQGSAFADRLGRYDELAPHHDDVDFEPPSDAEPGDWESKLGERLRDDPASKPNKDAKAFSRYT